MSVIRFKSSLAISILVTGLLAISPVCANLVENGSFETDSFCGANDITGWAEYGNTGLAWNPDIYGYPSMNDNGLIPDGKNAAYLLDKDSSISQTIYRMKAGVNYHLHYRDNSRNVWTSYSQVTVKLGDQTLDWHYFNSVENAWSYSKPYYTRDVDFTVAADGDYLLSFIQTGVIPSDLDPQYHACSLVDDIVLTGSAVPEPSSVLALLTGIAGLAGFARKRTF